MHNPNNLDNSNNPPYIQVTEYTWLETVEEEKLGQLTRHVGLELASVVLFITALATHRIARYVYTLTSPASYSSDSDPSHSDLFSPSASSFSNSHAFLGHGNGHSDFKQQQQLDSSNLPQSTGGIIGMGLPPVKVTLTAHQLTYIDWSDLLPAPLSDPSHSPTLPNKPVSLVRSERSERSDPHSGHPESDHVSSAPQASQTLERESKSESVKEKEKTKEWVIPVSLSKQVEVLGSESQQALCGLKVLLIGQGNLFTTVLTNLVCSGVGSEKNLGGWLKLRCDDEAEGSENEEEEEQSGLFLERGDRGLARGLVLAHRLKLFKENYPISCVSWPEGALGAEAEDDSTVTPTGPIDQTLEIANSDPSVSVSARSEQQRKNQKPDLIITCGLTSQQIRPILDELNLLPTAGQAAGPLWMQLQGPLWIPSHGHQQGVAVESRCRLTYGPLSVSALDRQKVRETQEDINGTVMRDVKVNKCNLSSRDARVTQAVDRAEEKGEGLAVTGLAVGWLSHQLTLLIPSIQAQESSVDRNESSQSGEGLEATPLSRVTSTQERSYEFDLRPTIRD